MSEVNPKCQGGMDERFHYCDSPVADDVRRHRLYDGQLFVYLSRVSVLSFAKFAKSMIEDAFGGRDPRAAQHEMEVGRYADLLGKLKPEFIHHPSQSVTFKTFSTNSAVILRKPTLTCQECARRQVTAI